MQANILLIEDRVRPKDTDFAALDHFRHRAVGTTDAACLIESPNPTLYCLDDAGRQAVFTDTPPEINLRESAFYYEAQYQHARRLLTVSYSTLNELADRVGDRFDKLILTYSVGRCGSTLLSRALNQVDSVLDLSEPEVYMQITALRPRDGSRDNEFRALLRSCTRLLFKPDQGQSVLAIKFRSFSIEIADLMNQVYPAANRLFLYRNAASWAQSQARAFGALEDDAGASVLAMLERNPKFVERTMPLALEYLRRHIRETSPPRELLWLAMLALMRQIPVLGRRLPTPAQFVAPRIRSIPRMKLLALQWLSVMDRYLDLHARGLMMHAIRYETMVASPEAVLRAIFQYCGLPLDQLGRAAAVFGQDSQAGSALARDRLAGRSALTEEHLQQVSEMVREFPKIATPDFVAPETLCV